MSHHITDTEVEKNILMENPVASDIKGTPSLDNYIK